MIDQRRASMTTVTPSAILATILVLSLFNTCLSQQPNIVFVLADDLGWNDVGYSPNSGLDTPWIDAIAAESVKLPWSYTQSVCTPSRAAIMTGLYPFRYGLQRGVIRADVPDSLDQDLVTLPQLLRQAGYATHLVGKWHLGYCNERSTPLQRGFDTFHGFLSGHESYYEHQNKIKDNLYYDYWDNDQPDRSQNYSMHDYTKHSLDAIRGERPFFLYLSSQSPHGPLDLPPEVANLDVESQRDRFRYVVRELDESVGKIVTALKEAQIWDDTVFIFSSDNGGQPLFGGNNFPLRGTKHTLWEGGTRVRTFIHSINLSPGKYRGLFHAVDWLPTIISMAEAVEPSGLDGLNHWPALKDPNIPHPRNSFIYNLDVHVKNNGRKLTDAAIRLRENNGSGYQDYKLVVGSPGFRNGWYPPGQRRTRQTHLRFDQGALFDMTTKDGRTERKQVHDKDEVKARMLRILLDEMKKCYEDSKQLEPSPKAGQITDEQGRPIIGPGWC